MKSCSSSRGLLGALGGISGGSVRRRSSLQRRRLRDLVRLDPRQHNCHCLVSGIASGSFRAISPRQLVPDYAPLRPAPITSSLFAGTTP